jgi:membrane protein
VDLHKVKSLLSRTYEQWSKHDDQTWGAALSYYTVLSLAPLLVIAISIAGLIFGQKAAQGEIVNQVSGLVGAAGAEAIQTMLAHTKSPGAGIAASIIGFGVLLFGASCVFTALRRALNRIWEVKQPQGSSWWAMLRDEFFSFAMVAGIGFLLLVSLLVSATLSALGTFMGDFVPVGPVRIVNWIVSLVVITFLFAVIYRVVPQQTLPWRGLRIGSFMTAVLFTLGKFLLGLYLGKVSVGSPYGAAGSLVVLLVWVYYSSQLFLFGAEFTRLYACDRGIVCLNLGAIPQNKLIYERT